MSRPRGNSAGEQKCSGEEERSKKSSSAEPYFPSGVSSSGSTGSNGRKKGKLSFWANLFQRNSRITEEVPGGDTESVSSYESANSAATTNSFAFVSPKKYSPGNKKAGAGAKGKRIPVDSTGDKNAAKKGTCGGNGTFSKIGVKIGLKKKYNLQSCESLEHLSVQGGTLQRRMRLWREDAAAEEEIQRKKGAKTKRLSITPEVRVDKGSENSTENVSTESSPTAQEIPRMNPTSDSKLFPGRTQVGENSPERVQVVLAKGENAPGTSEDSLAATLESSSPLKTAQNTPDLEVSQTVSENCPPVLESSKITFEERKTSNSNSGKPDGSAEGSLSTGYDSSTWGGSSGTRKRRAPPPPAANMLDQGNCSQYKSGTYNSHFSRDNLRLRAAE
jgi:hypothetical protein